MKQEHKSVIPVVDSDYILTNILFVCWWLGRIFCFFSPEQFTGLFIPGMGLGLLMPKFLVSIKQIFGWPLPGAHNPKGRSIKLVCVC